MEDIGPAAGLVAIMMGMMGLGALLPIALLFVDYRKRGEIHKPFIYVAVLFFTLAVVLPLLLRAFGLWLALLVPVAMFAYLGFIVMSKRRSP